MTSVELVQYWGDDRMIVNAARVSLGKHKEVLDEKDAKLIKYLVNHNHVSTLEHCGFTFRLKIPIFVARQLMRHKSWSFNEISGRYVEFEPEFYFPEQWRQQDENVKQGSKDEAIQSSDWATYHYNRAVQIAFEAYTCLLEEGVCKEQARMVLPLSLMTELYATCNLRSFAHFLALRMDSHAQKEIQMIAKKMLELVMGIPDEPFKLSLEAFGYDS